MLQPFHSHIEGVVGSRGAAVEADLRQGFGEAFGRTENGVSHGLCARRRDRHLETAQCQISPFDPVLDPAELLDEVVSAVLLRCGGDDRVVRQHISGGEDGEGLGVALVRLLIGARRFVGLVRRPLERFGGAARFAPSSGPWESCAWHAVAAPAISVISSAARILLLMGPQV